jgi:superfamily II DNA or RNA helicase
MTLRDLEIKTEYRTKIDDIARDFLIPVLSEAIEYKRAVGFFSSSALSQVAEGVCRIAGKGGHIELIASPHLSEEDVKAISEGYEKREEVIKRRMLLSMSPAETLSDLERDRLNLLAYLISVGTLDIKIAFAESTNGIGIYHEKMAIVVDEDGNEVAFSGSMNESANAMVENYEAIDVFRSWSDPEDRVSSKLAAFNAIWNDIEPGVKTYQFPEVKEEIVDRYLTHKPDMTDDLIDDASGSILPAATAYTKEPYPRIPEEYTLRKYQIEAIEKWEEQGFRGIYDMATGAGKTVTALASVVKLANKLNNKLAVIIVCPFQHLVDQWVEDITAFNINPIIAYSASPQKDWEKRLKSAIRDQKLGVSESEFFCLICTNATYAGDKVQNALRKIRSKRLLIVDEAHNFGAEYLRSILDPGIEYRLALSATIERYGDPEGTSALFEYFGDRCIEYTLDEAINGRGDEPPCLTPYRYYPIVVLLEDDELREYSRLSDEIAKRGLTKSKSGKITLSEKGKYLALKRARIVAGARGKIPALKEAISDYKDDNFILVYCGATKVEVDSAEVSGIDSYEARQIDVVKHLLGDELEMRVRQFTSRETSAEREEIKEMFSTGKQLQALVAIKCLDEGVNIPMIKTAFILASTTNPREYIQRRGRLLRKDKQGRKKRAEIYDFVTLPRDPADMISLTAEETRGEKRLVYNELVRAKEFARLAENRIRVSAILDEIEEGFFGINGIKGFDSREAE